MLINRHLYFDLWENLPEVNCYMVDNQRMANTHQLSFRPERSVAEKSMRKVSRLIINYLHIPPAVFLPQAFSVSN